MPFGVDFSDEDTATVSKLVSAFRGTMNSVNSQSTVKTYQGLSALAILTGQYLAANDLPPKHWKRTLGEFESMARKKYEGALKQNEEITWGFTKRRSLRR